MNRKERMRLMHEKGLTCEDIGLIEGIPAQRVHRILDPRKAKVQSARLLTVAAAAEYLGVHANTLRRWANDGLIQSVRLANTRRDRRFSRESLDKFLQGEAVTIIGGQSNSVSKGVAP
jgi:excisionase family DNA binding protein